MTTVAPAVALVSTQPVSPHGLAGFICEVAGSPVAFADCLTCAQSAKNKGCPLTAPVVGAILAGIRPPDLAKQVAAEHGAERGFSVTELLHCPRRQRLEQDHTWYEKPICLYRMTRGTAVHETLSRWSGGLKESRLIWTFKFLGRTITLTGMPDLVELRPEGLFITDFKVTEKPPRDKTTWFCSGCTTAVTKSGSKFLCPNCGEIARSAAYRTMEAARARSSHILQTNLYGLLIEKNIRQVAAALSAAGEPLVCGGEVLYLPPTLPMRCPVQYDREATMAFLKDRLKVLLSPTLPPALAEDDEGHWECDYCPLADVCASASSWFIPTRGEGRPGSPFPLWTTGYTPVSKNRASGNLIRRYAEMATNNSNGKARRQNFVSFTLQAAGEGDVKYAASGKPWGKIRAFFSQGKDKQSGEFLPSIWFTVKAFSKTEELEGPVAVLLNLARGNKFTVKGRLSMEEWEGNEGVKHQAYVISASSIEPFVPEAETEVEQLEGEPA